MAKPTPGQSYTVVSGDNLTSIAARAYADPSKWPIISKANQSPARTADKTLIIAGEVLIIPLLSSLSNLDSKTLPNKQSEELTVRIGSKEVSVLEADILRTMDTVVDEWTVKLPWEVGKDLDFDELIRPRRGVSTPASVFIGGKRLINGVLYRRRPKLDETGSTLLLTGYSFTVHLFDSMMKPPYEFNKITLEKRAEELVQPFGIKAVFDTSSGGPFDKITTSESETIFTHLAKYASQRSLLVSSTVDGDLLFLQANLNSSPVGTINQSRIQNAITGAESFEADFDDRKLFNVYRATGQTPGNNKLEGIAKDNLVTEARIKNFSADESTTGGIQAAAEWHRNTQLAKAYSFPLPVSGWLAPNGEVWRENTLVTVISPNLFLPDGFSFLINKVEFILSSEGKRAVLSLVLPTAYSKGELITPF